MEFSADDCPDFFGHLCLCFPWGAKGYDLQRDSSARNYDSGFDSDVLSRSSTVSWASRASKRSSGEDASCLEDPSSFATNCSDGCVGSSRWSRLRAQFWVLVHRLPS